LVDELYPPYWKNLLDKAQSDLINYLATVKSVKNLNPVLHQSELFPNNEEKLIQKSKVSAAFKLGLY
jgi:hypothetical protein